MSINKKEYEYLVKKESPSSPLFKDTLWAFFVGGIICTIGQVFKNYYSLIGLNKEQTATATAITMVFLGALLTGLQIYDKIAKKAGAGTIVPITGFANAIVAPAMEFKSEGLILGMAAKLFVIAGPVLVYGISASVIYGLILYFFG